MGYWTTFTGELTLSGTLTADQFENLHPMWGYGEELMWTRSDDEGPQTIGVLTLNSGKVHGYIQETVNLLRILTTLGLKAEGTLAWQGESVEDFGKIVVDDNELELYVAHPVTVESMLIMATPQSPSPSQPPVNGKVL